MLRPNRRPRTAPSSTLSGSVRPRASLYPCTTGRATSLGYREDDQGRAIISRLDEATLQEIARAGGGKYFRAVERGAIAGLVDEIQSFQDESLQSEFNRTNIERFQIFLLLGVLSLVIAELMTDRLSLSLRRRRATAIEEAGRA